MSIKKRSSRTRSLSGKFNPSVAAEKVHEITLTLEQSGLTRPDRKKVSASSSRVPDALIQRVATLASQLGGNVLGIQFDIEAAQQTLAYASECRAVIDAADELSRRVDDDVLQHRSVVAERAFALYKALGDLVRTPEGKHLQTAHEQMRNIVRAHKPSRRPKQTASAPATPAPQAPSNSTAPAAQPVVSK